MRCQLSYVLLASIEFLLGDGRVREIARWVRNSKPFGGIGRTYRVLPQLVAQSIAHGLELSE